MSKKRRYRKILKAIDIIPEDDRVILDTSLNRLTYRHRNIDSEFDEDHVKRVMVNHIRHCNTPYDDLMSICDYEDVYDYNIPSLYMLIKNRTLDLISQAYPYLNRACKRQAVHF